MLGCNLNSFKKHFKDKFTKDMNWKEFSKGNIHIDHIQPLSSFNLLNIDEQQKAFHYTNLQPLWAKDNLSKGSKLL